MNDFTKIIIDMMSWTIIAAVLVLIIMNADKFATAITSLTGFWMSETSMFTGSGYNTATYGQVQQSAYGKSSTGH